jgi:hypothetical protein
VRCHEKTVDSLRGLFSGLAVGKPRVASCRGARLCPPPISVTALGNLVKVGLISSTGTKAAGGS